MTLEALQIYIQYTLFSSWKLLYKLTTLLKCPYYTILRLIILIWSLKQLVYMHPMAKKHSEYTVHCSISSFLTVSETVRSL